MRIAVVGGGQLGRMLALAGIPLGMRFRFLDPSSSSCAASTGELICADYDDADGLDRLIADTAYATFEFENIPASTANRLAERVSFSPSSRSLATCQDRILEKHLFRECGVGVQPFAAVSSDGDIATALDRVGVPGILKTRRDGYDGNGQQRVHQPNELAAAWKSLGRVPCIYEALVPFDREVSLVAVRSRTASGTQFATYPLCENIHEHGILSVTRARANDPLWSAACTHVEAIMNHLDHVGVLAVEFFVCDGALIANEMAPRVHNSGHWTMDGAVTSQFENHLRALVSWPLGSTALVGSSAMVNLIGSIPETTELLAVPGARLHLYGKSARPGRKIGHVNVVAQNDEACERAIATLLAICARAK
ncbi:MAG: 5-(carboxyamino)imidazole ribonucleotide synthase [Planctomycetota bacterium]|nr:5-(carboxyamino)imidazole ribonucleotide synthase [Planctomycetota bacterium]